MLHPLTKTSLLGENSSIDCDCVELSGRCPKNFDITTTYQSGTRNDSYQRIRLIANYITST
jgi:hypothetical protein